MIPSTGNSFQKLGFGSTRREGVFQRWKDPLLYTGGGTEPEWAPQSGCECTIHIGSSISVSFFFFTQIFNTSPHVLESFHVNGWKSLMKLLIGVSDL